jgi:hypothetical protein
MLTNLCQKICGTCFSFSNEIFYMCAINYGTKPPTTCLRRPKYLSLEQIHNLCIIVSYLMAKLINLRVKISHAWYKICVTCSIIDFKAF